MEFQYFLDRTPIDPANLLVLMQNFALDQTGTFLSSTESLQDLTVMTTFEKTKATPQVILSNYNYSGGHSGFVLGVDQGNFLYVDVPNANFNHTFRNINLAKKNCLAIKKADRNLSIHQLDLQSNTIFRSETIAFPANANLEAATRFHFGESFTHPIYSGQLLYGAEQLTATVDQLAVLNVALDETYILKLLSGFKPYTLSSGDVSSVSLTLSEVRFPNGNPLSSTGFVLAAMQRVDNEAYIALQSGEWSAYYTGYFNPTEIYSSGYMTTGNVLCYSSDAVAFRSNAVDDGSSAGETGIFTDTMMIKILSGKYVFSHNMAVSMSGVSPFVISYDTLYQAQTSPVLSLTHDPDYYTGFKMDGVISEYTDQIALSHHTGSAPTGYNLQGLYDQAQQAFYVPDFHPGLLYYTGKLYPSNYAIISGYLVVTGVVQNDTHYAIADNVAPLPGPPHLTSTFLDSGVNNWATGQFYPGAAQVYSGGFNTGRMKNTLYKETSEGHLYHASKIQPTGSSFLFSL